jgi:hypothetical protein
MVACDDEYPDKLGSFSVDKEWDKHKGGLTDNLTKEEKEAHEVWLKLVEDINDLLGEDDIDILRISQYKD